MHERVLVVEKRHVLPVNAERVRVHEHRDHALAALNELDEHGVVDERPRDRLRIHDIGVRLVPLLVQVTLERRHLGDVFAGIGGFTHHDAEARCFRGEEEGHEEVDRGQDLVVGRRVVVGRAAEEEVGAKPLVHAHPVIAGFEARVRDVVVERVAVVGLLGNLHAASFTMSPVFVIRCFSWSCFTRTGFGTSASRTSESALSAWPP